MRRFVIGLGVGLVMGSATVIVVLTPYALLLVVPRTDAVFESPTGLIKQE